MDWGEGAIVSCSLRGARIADERSTSREWPVWDALPRARSRATATPGAGSYLLGFSLVPPTTTYTDALAAVSVPIAVDGVILVTCWAMCLSELCVTPTLNHLTRVLSANPDRQMRWVAARRVVAGVQDQCVVGDRRADDIDEDGAVALHCAVEAADHIQIVLVDECGVMRSCAWQRARGRPLCDRAIHIQLRGEDASFRFLLALAADDIDPALVMQRRMMEARGR